MIPRWLLPLPLLFLAACGPKAVPNLPWGQAEVREIVQVGACTVYGLVSDPDHTFWTVCPGQP